MPDSYDSIWEGTSPNAAADFARLARAGNAPDNSWLDRLFSSNAPKRSMEANGPPVDVHPSSPFGGPPAAPAAPSPATRISSAGDIASRIARMIGAANEPPPVSGADFGDPLATAVNQIPNAEEPPPPRVPIDMREEASTSPFGGHTFDGNRFGGNQFDGNIFGGNQFGAGATRGQDAASNVGASAGLPQNIIDAVRAILGLTGGAPEVAGAPYAHGGDVPGYMRGGYPELRTAPIRHQFDSGGANYVDGDSDGRADDIDARLSSGEYVVDAETLSLLGNGNSKAGANKMDSFRENVRRHKGKSLAKGKISPDAKKNPAEYLIGNPMGDGMRRQGKSK